MKSYNVDDSIWARFESWEPYITIRIIIINTVIFLFTEAAPNSIYKHFALNYTDVVVFNQHYRMFTAMFLHGGFMHLADNMLVIGLLGYVIEKRFGRAQFLTIYLAAGYLGFVCALFWQYNPHITGALGQPLSQSQLLDYLSFPTLGASGAAMGLLAAWFAYERSQRVSLAQMWQSPTGKPVVILTAYYVAVNVFGGNRHISYSAHFGGFVGGLLLGFFFASRRYRGSTLPRTGWMCLALYLLVTFGGVAYIYASSPLRG